MWKSRQYRIARSVTSVLQEEDIPTLPSHEKDVTRDTEWGFIRRKYFETSDGKLYFVSFTCGDEDGGALENVCTISFFPSGGGRESENTVEVLKGVLSKIREMIAEFHPKYLKFQGTTDSRDRLYDVMVRRFFPGRFWKDHGYIYVDLGDDPVKGDGGRVGVLQEGDIPEFLPHSMDEKVTYGPMETTRKFFDTSDGKQYWVSFKCEDDDMGEAGKLFRLCEVGFFARGRRSQNTTEVLKGVMSKVREMIPETNPDYLTFRGTSASRDRLYDVMVRRFFPGRFWREGGCFYVALKNNPIFGEV